MNAQLELATHAALQAARVFAPKSRQFGGVQKGGACAEQEVHCLGALHWPLGGGGGGGGGVGMGQLEMLAVRATQSSCTCSQG